MRNDEGEIGFRVYVGGGLGRTPMIGRMVRDFLPERDLLGYVEAILRVYNLEGRRDNKFKARIKILVHEKGLEALREEVEAEFAARDPNALNLPEKELARFRAFFAPPELDLKKSVSDRVERRKGKDARFASFLASNVVPHKTPGYGVVTISLKAIGAIPGDASADQMDAVADLAEDYSHDEVRVSHEQNLILPHIALDDLPAVYDRLASVGLSTPNAGAISDIIACPGLDYCALATARSIPVAQRIAERFGDGQRSKEIGPLKDQDLRLHQCLRPPSRRPYRHSRPRAGRGRDLPDHAWRLRRRKGRDRPDHRAWLQLRECGRGDRDHRRNLYGPQALGAGDLH